MRVCIVPIVCVCVDAKLLSVEERRDRNENSEPRYAERTGREPKKKSSPQYTQGVAQKCVELQGRYYSGLPRNSGS